MNEIAPISKVPRPRPVATTQAADGLPRFKWSLAQFEQLIEHGILTEADRVELIGGELVPMAAKGNRHENLRAILQHKLNRALPDNTMLCAELGWRPGCDTYLEPDLMICHETLQPSELPGQLALLVIEVAKSSLEFDQGAKAKVYAALGVREYWVVDAVTLSTRVFREPSAEGYGVWRDVPPDETLEPHLVPATAVSLGGLGIG